MTIKWDHPAAIALRKEIVEGIVEELRTLCPNKGNKMNAIKAMAEIPSVDTKHILVLDADGNETVAAFDPSQVAQDKEYSDVAAGN